MHACLLSLFAGAFQRGNQLQQSRDGGKSKEDQCLGKNMVSEEQQQCTLQNECVRGIGSSCREEREREREREGKADGK